jgi:hypothetical protein
VNGVREQDETGDGKRLESEERVSDDSDEMSGSGSVVVGRGRNLPFGARAGYGGRNARVQRSRFFGVDVFSE